MKPQYLWLDTETTNLDVRKAALLEVGAAVVDANFKVLSTFERVVHFDIGGHHPHAAISLAAHNMHTENGLWADSARSKLSAQEVDIDLANWALEWFSCGTIRLGGRAVWYDRRIADLFLPRFTSCLSGEQFESGTLIATNRHLDFPPLEHADHPHRALRDVLGDLTDVRAYMARFNGALP